MSNLKHFIIILSSFLYFSCNNEKIHTISEFENPVMMLSQSSISAYSPFLTPSDCLTGFGLCDLQLEDQGLSDFYSLIIELPETINEKQYLPIILQESVPHNNGILHIDLEYEIPSEISNAMGYDYINLQTGNYPLSFSLHPYGYTQIEITTVINEGK